MGNQKKRQAKDPEHVAAADEFSPETIRKKRTLPVKDIVILCVLIVLQVALICVMVLYQPKPKDIIDRYAVTVEPLADGTLDITYEIVWTALDEEEPLTWVEIGMPTLHHSLYQSSISDCVADESYFLEDGYASHRFYFHRSYRGGETVSFSFKINVPGMLMSNRTGYIYEFVPGWFNAIPVEEYVFRWKLSEGVVSHNAPVSRDGYAIWQGSLGCGEYVNLKVSYDSEAFHPVVAPLVYKAFETDGAYDALAEEQIAMRAIFFLFILIMLAWEIYIVDGFISYRFGRGFLRGYGHRVHTYGHVNPHYRRAYLAHSATSGSRGGGGGRGCACACACACAGGGRAGCSQKNTVWKRTRRAENGERKNDGRNFLKEVPPGPPSRTLNME